jgi:hypothetical protein
MAICEYAKSMQLASIEDLQCDEVQRTLRSDTGQLEAENCLNPSNEEIGIPDSCEMLERC